MAVKYKHDILAGIDVGSHALRMKIAAISKNGRITTLESLRQPVALGRDTFAQGKISFQTVSETSGILKGFRKLMDDYKVKNYRALATGAVREALNRDYVLDQLRLDTGLEINVINNSEERFLTYKAIPEAVPDFRELKKEGLLLVDIGSGSIQVTSYKGGMEFSQNLKLGSLRIKEVLSNIAGKTIDFLSLLDEYLDCHLDRAETFMYPNTCKNFMALGFDTRTILGLCGNTDKNGAPVKVNTGDFLSLYDSLIQKAPREIVRQLGVAADRVDLLLPTVMIFRKFLKATAADVIYSPPVSLRDGIIADLAEKYARAKKPAACAQDIVSAARYLGGRYLYDRRHAEDVEEKALTLFDRLKKLHGMGARQRLLLQLAAILHDTGKFINSKRHYIHSYEIIKASEIPGLATEELHIVANIARYHSSKVPVESDPNFTGMPEQDRLVTAKLAAILKLADALDKSHRQKINRLLVEPEREQVIIRVESTENILLEEWAFEKKSEYFREVFGAAPVIKVKRTVGHG